jgi:hypothetical protein
VIPINSSFAKNAASGIIIVDIAEQRDADQTNAPPKKIKNNNNNNNNNHHHHHHKMQLICDNKKTSDKM